MAKSTVKQEELKETPATVQTPEVKGETNQFMNDLSALTYYQINGSKIKFESLPEAEKNSYVKLAAGVLVSLDKMNKMVAPKVSAKQVETDNHKNVQLLTSIIENFVKGLKTIKCPKCGSNAEIRALIFPCTELAHRIWNGGK